MVEPLIAPVSGSVGAVPETNTRPAALTAWLYVAGGLAAFGVKTIRRAILASLEFEARSMLDDVAKLPDTTSSPPVVRLRSLDDIVLNSNGVMRLL